MSIEELIGSSYIKNYPGLFCLTDLQSKVITVNQTGLKWIGFSSLDSIAGLSYENANCKVAEHAEYFVILDQKVITKEKPIFYLGHYLYANDEWKVILAKKFLLKDTNGQAVAVVTQLDDVTDYRLLDVSRFLIMNRTVNDNHDDQFGYILEKECLDGKLTVKESECLFFWLRGKTAPEIGKILNLSNRTIEDYLEKLKNKLGCQNKAELIEKSFAMGWTNFFPQTLLGKKLK